MEHFRTACVLRKIASVIGICLIPVADPELGNSYGRLFNLLLETLNAFYYIRKIITFEQQIRPNSGGIYKTPILPGDKLIAGECVRPLYNHHCLNYIWLQIITRGWKIKTIRFNGYSFVTIYILLAFSVARIYIYTSYLFFYYYYSYLGKRYLRGRHSFSKTIILFKWHCHIKTKKNK